MLGEKTLTPDACSAIIKHTFKQAIEIYEVSKSELIEGRKIKHSLIRGSCILIIRAVTKLSFREIGKELSMNFSTIYKSAKEWAIEEDFPAAKNAWMLPRHKKLQKIIEDFITLYH